MTKKELIITYFSSVAALWGLLFFIAAIVDSFPNQSFPALTIFLFVAGLLPMCYVMLFVFSFDILVCVFCDEGDNDA